MSIHHKSVCKRFMYSQTSRRPSRERYATQNIESLGTHRWGANPGIWAFSSSAGSGPVLSTALATIRTHPDPTTP